MEQTKDSFIKGTAILGIAAFISKILAAVYRVPYQNITGDEGMYIFQQVYPLYSVLLILATAGFPIAISKMISERVALGDLSGVNQIYRISSYLLIGLGCSLFLLLFFGAKIVAGWMGNPAMLTLPIQVVSFALLIVPVMAAIRGLFQGYQKMVPTALSQVTEQTIRVATILFLAWYCMDQGLGVIYAGAGATLGAFTGAIGGLLVLIFFLRQNKRHFQHTKKGNASLRTGVLIKQLFLISLPICLGSLAMPLYGLIDSFSVANILEHSQYTLHEAVQMKGIYDRGQPLLQFAAFFSTVLALSVVPAIAKARVEKDQDQIRRLASLSLRFTWVFGLPASIGLVIVAEPTNVMLFQDAAGTGALMILACGTIFLTLNITAAGIMQGIGKIYLPALYLLVGIIIKILGNVWLIPAFDISGAAMATLLAYFVHALLSLHALHRLTSLTVQDRSLIKRFLYVQLGMSIVTIATMTILQMVCNPLSERLAMTIVALGSVSTGALTYSLLLFRFQLIAKEDLQKMPKFADKLIPILERWNILKEHK